jgi:hypothetical protein
MKIELRKLDKNMPKEVIVGFLKAWPFFAGIAVGLFWGAGSVSQMLGDPITTTTVELLGWIIASILWAVILFGVWMLFANVNILFGMGILFLIKLIKGRSIHERETGKSR